MNCVLPPMQPLSDNDPAPSFDSGRSSHPHKAKTCLTPACIHASSEYLYNLSPQYKELDPCDNFEELVCGGWKDRHDLRPDQGSAFTGTIMSEGSQTLLRHVLEGTYPKQSEVCPSLFLYGQPQPSSSSFSLSPA